MQKILFYQEKEHRQFEKNLHTTIDTLKEAQKELRKQGVKGMSLEILKHGNFLEIFEEFYRKQQGKNFITKNMVYDKYLELYGYTTEELEKIEKVYKAEISRTYTFYKNNDSFYKYCSSHRNQDVKIKEHFKKAPSTKDYEVFDFLTINDNNCSLDVPKSLFTLYSSSNKPFQIIENVKSFISISKEMELEYNQVLEPIKKFIRHYPNTGVIGLSRNFSEVTFDYEKLLIYQ